MAVADLDIHTVAILDDDENEAEAIAVQLEDVGLESCIVRPRGRELDACVVQMRESGDAAICDHWLRRGLDVDFNGAQVAAALNDEERPAVLLTSFLMDAGVTIRPHRPSVPTLLSRDEAENTGRVLEAFAFTIDERRNGRGPTRATYRVPVSIERVFRDEGKDVADGIVGGWRLEQAVRFPLSLLAERWASASRDAEGKIFFAMVNIGALRPEDLFFEQFEPDPAPERLVHGLFNLGELRRAA